MKLHVGTDYQRTGNAALSDAVVVVGGGGINWGRGVRPTIDIKTHF
jgi:hypothetical protein